MSFCGHEIHVGVDCFSVEPLGLRPRGSLFLPPPCELVYQNPTCRALSFQKGSVKYQKRLTKPFDML